MDEKRLGKNKFKFDPNLVGFTLIELLVSIAIIAILLGLGVAEYMRFNRSQLLVQAAGELKSDLRLIQSKALSGEIPEDCGYLPLTGYEIEFFDTQNLSHYTVAAVCQDTKVAIKTVNLPKGVSLDEPSVNPILFKVLGAGTNIPAPGDGFGEVGIGLFGFGSSSFVTILHTGDIK